MASLFGEHFDRAAPESRLEVPPFSVLNAREASWQNRKRAWLRAGVDGRYDVRNGVFDHESDTEPLGYVASRGFDPVLAECMIDWFTAPGDRVLDPFAGGITRGAVAGLMRRGYLGVDVREQQVEANVQAVASLGLSSVEYQAADSASFLRTLAPGSFDFVLTCPPYGDLERYSDDPRDLSTMRYESFLPAYEAVIGSTLRALRDDRFAVFVVGDFRQRAGFTSIRGPLCPLTSDTVAIAARHGALLYNTAILVTPTGTLAGRASFQFGATRKLGMAHQTALCFIKGDWLKASKRVASGQ